MTGHVVVGVDESDWATAALRWAVREAEVRNTTVLAVLAWSYIDQHPSDGFDPHYTAADADAALDALIAAALPAGEASRVRRHAVCDLPARALLDAATGQEMLVVGARGLGGFRGLLLGSVSQHCVHAATTPTVVVRNVSGPTDRSGIVVGVDGSEHARRALAWAAQAARLRSGSLTVVHGYELPLRAHLSPTFDPGAVEASAHDLVDAALNGIGRADLHLSTVVSAAGAAGALIDAAADSDLVVVGSRGRGAVQRLVLGSVATQVLQHAPCSVAVIP